MVNNFRFYAYFFFSHKKCVWYCVWGFVILRWLKLISKVFLWFGRMYKHSTLYYVLNKIQYRHLESSCKVYMYLYTLRRCLVNLYNSWIISLLLVIVFDCTHFSIAYALEAITKYMLSNFEKYYYKSLFVFCRFTVKLSLFLYR